MKGLVISLAAFVLYVTGTTVLSHVLRPRVHSRLLFPAVLACSPVYALLYWLAPPDAWCLPAAWLSTRPWLDAAFGYAVYLLNCHSYIDFFYGFNCGFSAGLLVDLSRAGTGGLTTEHFIRRFHRPDGTDKIFGWRLPGLERDGYLWRDPDSGRYRLTPKGAAVARLAWFCKRVLNLGAGG